MTKKLATPRLTPLEETVISYFASSVDDYIADGSTLGIPAALIASRLNMTKDKAMGIVGSLVKKGILFTNKTSSGIILVGLRDEESLETLERALLESVHKAEETHYHSGCCNHNHPEESLTETDGLLKELIFVNTRILKVLKDPAVDQQKLIAICGGNLEGSILTTELLIDILRETPQLLGDPNQELISSYEILESLSQSLGYMDSKTATANPQPAAKKSVEFSIEEMEALKELATNLLTQDTRGTQTPIWFLLQDVKKDLDGSGVDGYVYYDSDACEQFEAESEEELVQDVLRSNDLLEDLERRAFEEVIEENQIEVINMQQLLTTANKELFDDRLQALQEQVSDIEEAVRSELVGYRYEYETKGTFFTEKAAKEHLRLNKHHYSDRARIYVVHAWRDPEAELVHKVLTSFAK